MPSFLGREVGMIPSRLAFHALAEQGMVLKGSRALIRVSNFLI